jgi:hypothetical protein
MNLGECPSNVRHRVRHRSCAYHLNPLPPAAATAIRDHVGTPLRSDRRDSSSLHGAVMQAAAGRSGWIELRLAAN